VKHSSELSSAAISANDPALVPSSDQADSSLKHDSKIDTEGHSTIAIPMSVDGSPDVNTIFTKPLRAQSSQVSTDNPRITTPARSASAESTMSSHSNRSINSDHSSAVPGTTDGVTTPQRKPSGNANPLAAAEKQKVILNMALEEILLVTYRPDCAANDSSMYFAGSTAAAPAASPTKTNGSFPQIGVENVSELICARLIEGRENRGAMSYLVGALKRLANREQLAEEKLREELQR
jgi:hypothetical protein